MKEQSELEPTMRRRDRKNTWDKTTVVSRWLSKGDRVTVAGQGDGVITECGGTYWHTVRLDSGKTVQAGYDDIQLVQANDAD